MITHVILQIKFRSVKHYRITDLNSSSIKHPLSNPGMSLELLFTALTFPFLSTFPILESSHAGNDSIADKWS